MLLRCVINVSRQFTISPWERLSLLSSILLAELDIQVRSLAQPKGPGNAWICRNEGVTPRYIYSFACMSLTVVAISNSALSFVAGARRTPTRREAASGFLVAAACTDHPVMCRGVGCSGELRPRVPASALARIRDLRFLTSRRLSPRRAQTVNH